MFAISLTPSVNASSVDEPVLSVRQARFTTRWESVNDTQVQSVEVALDNLLPISAFSQNTSITSPITIELSGSGLTTVTPGTINRLIASDRVRTDVLITSGNLTGNATVVLKDASGNTIGVSDGWPITPLPEKWTTDPSLLLTHESPTWVSLRSAVQMLKLKVNI
jgi:alpha-L-fucosidase